MFYSLVNKVIRFNLKKYMEELMHSSHEPFVAQRAVMSALLQQAKNTEFGKAYGFDTIHDFNTFSKRIPLATYGDLKGSIERMRSGESNVLWPGQVKWYAKALELPQENRSIFLFRRTASTVVISQADDMNWPCTLTTGQNQNCLKGSDSAWADQQFLNSMA